MSLPLVAMALRAGQDAAQWDRPHNKNVLVLNVSPLFEECVYYAECNGISEYMNSLTSNCYFFFNAKQL